jgi:GNAT superfamily N-acetyltransferase
MQGVRIQRAGAADVPALCGLVEDYWRFEQLAGFDRSRVANALEGFFSDSRNGLGWVAFAGAQPVGYLLAAHVFSLEDFGRTAEIDELYVSDTHRGQGIGTLLLREAQQALAAAGCSCISLRLGRANSSGRSFYHHHGFCAREGFDLLEKRL